MSESTEMVPSEQDAPQQSAAAQQKARIDALITAVEGKSEQLQTLLGDSGIPFKKFVEVFRRALIQNPDILRADAGSIIQACINACTDGLLPDGRQGAIVVRNQNVAARGQPKRWVPKASWSPMFQGLAEIAYASGNFKDIQARVVYAVDEFDYALGIDPWITHKPGRRAAISDGANPHEITHAYAVAKGRDGGVWVEVFEPDDIRKVKAVSAAVSGPWKGWESEMIRKGPFRRMWKWLPKSDRMRRVMEHDDDNYDQDLLEAPAAPERKLQAGFAPKAIEQGADPTIDLPMDQAEDFEVPAKVHATERMGTFHPGDGTGTFGTTQPQEAAQEPRERPAAPDVAPEAFKPFLEALASATSWLTIKQALRTLAKAEGEVGERGLAAAWARFEDLRAEGAERTDFISDPLLFECWIVGAEHDADSVEGNWRIVQKDSAFTKSPQEVQDRIARRVQEAME